MRSVKLNLLASLFSLMLASTAQGISFPDGFSFDFSLTSGNIYTEVGDAGDHLNPQSITGTGITQIDGNIGGISDPTDAFLFFFAGGDIQFIGAAFFENGDGGIGPTFNGDGVTAVPLDDLDLFSAALPTDPVKPDNFAPGVITFFGLGAGNYIIEGSFLGDPPFSIGILNPTTGQPQSISAPVPEPGSALLLAVGLLGLWRVRIRHG